MSPFDPTPEAVEALPDRWSATTIRCNPVSVNPAAGTAIVNTGTLHGRCDITFEVMTPSALQLIGSRIGQDTMLDGMAHYRAGDAMLLGGRVWEARPGPGPFDPDKYRPPLKLSMTDDQWVELWRNVEEDELEDAREWAEEEAARKAEENAG